MDRGQLLQQHHLRGDPLAQGWGEHIFWPVDAGSEQLAWLEQELASPAWQRAPFRVVILHEVRRDSATR